MDAARNLIYAEDYEKKIYTHEDIYALPEGKRAEIIDGRWYDMATPNIIHQRLVVNIGGELRDYIRSKGGDCEVFVAPIAVFLTESRRNWLEPDVVVVCDKDKLKDGDACHGAPDLVVEVVSPGTRKKDMGVKLFKYRTEGVREYWIVDPEEECTLLYNFEGDGEKGEGERIGFDEWLVSKMCPDFSIRLADFV